ncbi:MAG: hypothetical protein SOV91_01110 [Eubacteriales bacterium]|nr:hypothetical protein [Eubacteriales bacterium]
MKKLLFFKKGVDNGDFGCYNEQAVREGAAEWSLKIEQQRGQSTKEICERSRQFLKRNKL